VDGYLRDTKGILALDFPAFAYGSYAQDQGPRGKVIDFRFGDIDGVCVVPRQAEQEVFAGAIEKARGEKTVQKAIQAGMSAGEAFRKFGIM
jgi:regulator of RNase E activity RraA